MTTGYNICKLCKCKISLSNDPKYNESILKDICIICFRKIKEEEKIIIKELE